MLFWRRSLRIAGLAIALACGSVGLASADPPPDSPSSPFPDMATVRAYYTELPPEDFFIPNAYGVWFLTPQGVNCGIWDRGGFGCTGAVPGLPPGENHIAWFNGNRAVHHGWTAAIQFRQGQAVRPLPPLSLVKFNSTTCLVTSEGNTACEHGEFKFKMTPQGTWYTNWDDRRSYSCLSYGSC